MRRRTLVIGLAVGAAALLGAAGLVGTGRSPLAPDGPPAADSAAPRPTASAAPSASPSPSTSPEPTPTPAAPLASRRVGDPDLTELSGLAASRLHRGVLFAINDSGNDPVVFAIGRDGRTVARLSLPGAANTDWEALAPGRAADGAPVLWIADIGDNAEQRPSISLYRINEPADLGDADIPWQQFTLTYPDGPHDAEALAVDPDDGSLLIITKEPDAGSIYRAPVPRDGVGTVLRRLRAAPPGITDAAYEPTASGTPRLVAVDYLAIHASSNAGRTWSSNLAPLQQQREAVAWPAGDPGTISNEVYLGTEGTASTILPAPVPR